MVFDNADDPSFLPVYWPSSSQGSIIITSRNRATLAEGFVQHGLHLKAFADEQSSKFVLSLLPQENVASSKDHTAISALANHFGGLPLALSQVATYMRTRNISPSEFEVMYKEHVDEIEGQGVPGYDKTLVNVWNMSINMLPDDSRLILDCVCLLDPDSIPVELFHGVNHTYQYWDTLPSGYHIYEAIARLSAQSLVDFEISSRSLRVHRFFQDATLRKLRKDSQRFRDISHLMVEMITKFTPEVNLAAVHNPKGWQNLKKSFNHVQCIHEKTQHVLTERGADMLLRCMTRILKYDYNPSSRNP
jgi:hypothetical protein